MTDVIRMGQVQPPQQVGNLFTLFLASPELALCVLMGNPAPEPEVAKRLQVRLADPGL